MHNNNHTPGPWSLGGSYDTNPHGEFEVYGAEFGHYATGRVAVVERRAGGAYLADSVSPHAQRLTAEANAQLIAAAPCMLLALTIARAHIRRALDEIPENDGNLSGALAVIGEAITKATGGDFE
jgi:hypothetical protein